MLSITAILILSAGLVRSAVVSVFPKAEVTAAPIANSSPAPSTTSECDYGYTTTTTTTLSGSGTVYEKATITAATSTQVITIPSYVATSYSSLGPVDGYVTYSYTGTTTGYAYDSVTVGYCTSFTTITTESTSTVYTGSYTPTALPDYCPTGLVREYRYLGGETTVTTSTVTSTPVVTSTTYEPDTSTIYTYDRTTTHTQLAESYTYTVETFTSSVPHSTPCTSTVYTATASTAATQTAKCAPTNLISGISAIENAGRLTNKWLDGAAANKDASSCCQACVEDDECIAMDFMGGAGNSSCALWLGTECGVSSIQVRFESIINEWTVQAGCGAVVHPEYWV